MSQFHFDPATYDDLMAREVPAYRELQAAVGAAAAGAKRAVERVLDLGTGTGATARAVLAAHPGAALVGIDENADMLTAARRALPGADLRTGRLEDPLPAGPFDLVVSALAVHHLDRPGKADLFRRVAATLAPGGRFVLGDLVVPDDPADVVTPIDGEYDTPDSAADQLAWLAAAGLEPRIGWQDRDLAVLVADLPA
ncbi:MAG TPA: class I SAM-dependent methyltransferase [Acidimicrobiales bacterium]